MPVKSKSKTRYIFVVGGVMSSVGKGITTASIGRILQSSGYKVEIIKCEMYVNIDAGTIRPTEHGEVFVGEDGIEADQDLGNYERFLGTSATRDNYITQGQVYLEVIRKERNLEYDGEDVEVIPDIPNEIIRRIKRVGQRKKADFVIIEIGGTVGEYQNLLFLEAARMMRLKDPEDVLFILVSYLPIPSKVGEMKTKPTQYAARTLNSSGIQPDFIVARADYPLDKKRKEKISVFCNVKTENVISAPDVETIYEVPLVLEKDRLAEKILTKFGIKSIKKPDLRAWKKMVQKTKRAKSPVKIGIVGKYFTTGDFTLADSYISVIESIKHAANALNKKPVLHWLNSDDFDPSNPNYRSNLSKLKEYHGIIVPGGFGSRGVEGKIQAIKYCRVNKIPYFGLCYGMQLAVVEFARSVLKLNKANTVEIDPKTPHPVIDIMPDQKQNLVEKNYGATMRLGAYPAKLQNGSIAQAAYGKKLISERHRHRYEVNPKYITRLQKGGLGFSGVSPDNRLMEIMELPRKVHPFFVGTQFHPEFKSRPLEPHPLFVEFIKASIKINKP